MKSVFAWLKELPYRQLISSEIFPNIPVLIVLALCIWGEDDEHGEKVKMITFLVGKTERSEHTAWHR
jgi:hypothetical protein